MQNNTNKVKKISPLLNTWILWLSQHSDNHKNISTEGWGEGFQQIYKIDTVESFWYLYDRILSASKLYKNSSYYVFKKNIQPDWHDENCKNGGRWYFSVKLSSIDIDNIWQTMLLCIIGESIDVKDHICGIIIESRAKETRFALWTKEARNKTVQIKIGDNLNNNLKEYVKDFNTNLSYQAFDSIYIRQLYKISNK